MVRSLYRPGAQLETVLKVYKADITAFQEMRWTGQGQKTSVPVMSTIVAMLLGTNSGVPLQWARVTNNSSQDLLQLKNA